jgi:tetratricopeptide (TPR) repeat protein
MARRKKLKPVKKPHIKSPATSAASKSSLRFLLAIFIVVLTAISFLPTFQNGFVDWDDNKTVLENPYYRGLSWSNIRWMFTTFHMGHYQPLSWVTLGLDYLLWGMDPFGYHLTSLILHCANALVLYYIALRILRWALAPDASDGGLALHASAALAALLFAIHPLRVESVAWVTERRDVLSGLFFLLTMLCYLNAAAAKIDGSVRRRWMISAVFVYCLSLLAKASGISLPIILILLDLYPLRRLPMSIAEWFRRPLGGIWREKIPFFLLAMLFGVVALLAQNEAGALRYIGDYGVARRVMQALYGILFYLWKTIIPLNLSPIYGIPVHLGTADYGLIVFSGFLTLVLTAGLFIGRRRWPALFTIWIYYLALLTPVLGLAQSGPQITADRYSYLACLGWALLVGAALFYLFNGRTCYQNGASKLRVCAIAVPLMLIALGTMTWQQTRIWHDAETLWSHAVSTNPQEPQAHNNLANAMVHRGATVQAIAQYREALRIEPDYKEAHHNLAITLAEQGELAEAIAHYRAALRLDPTYKEAHNNLGVALANHGELPEAIEHFRAALRIDPSFESARKNLDLLVPRQQPNS